MNVFETKNHGALRTRWPKNAVMLSHDDAKTYLAHHEQPTFHQLFWIFVICSVLGLVVETIVSYPIDGIWKNRAGFVWGPFSPIYGVGGVLVTLFLWELRNSRDLVLYIAAACVGATFEYAAGWFWENFFGIVAWSYADQPFNIDGHTCLGIALVWGLAGLAWMRIALPFVLQCIDSMPQAGRGWVTNALIVFVIVDAAMTIASFNFWFERKADIPQETPVQQFFEEHYGDTFMEDRFQTMSLYTDLAGKRQD